MFVTFNHSFGNLSSNLDEIIPVHSRAHSSDFALLLISLSVDKIVKKYVPAHTLWRTTKLYGGCCLTFFIEADVALLEGLLFLSTYKVDIQSACLKLSLFFYLLLVCQYEQLLRERHLVYVVHRLRDSFKFFLLGRLHRRKWSAMSILPLDLILTCRMSIIWRSDSLARIRILIRHHIVKFQVKWWHRWQLLQ